MTGDTKGALYHWSLDDGRLLYRVHEHRTLLAASAFSSDGTLLITGDKDGVALLWDAASGERLASFGGHAGRIEAVGFDPLGRAFIVDRNGRFSAWEPDRVDPLAQPIEALAGQSNIRVCKGTVDIRRVRPFPDASTPWAPADKCD